MALEKVKEKILAEALQKAESKTASAKLAAKEIEKSIARAIMEKEAELKASLEAEAENIRRKEEASAKLEARKATLAFKKAFIDSVFEGAKDKLKKLTAKEREIHIKSLIKKAESEIEIGTILCNQSDKAFAKNYKTEDVRIIGGIIAESPDGKVRIDLSYEAMLAELKERLSNEINTLLFEK